MKYVIEGRFGAEFAVYEYLDGASFVRYQIAVFERRRDAEMFVFHKEKEREAL